MTQIDRATAKLLGAEIQQALEAVAEKHGLTVSVRGGKYDDTMYAPKVEFKTESADEDQFNLYASWYGLEGKYGEVFNSHGRVFKIEAIAPRSPKRPIICEEVGTDKRFKFEAEAVARAVGRQTEYDEAVGA